MMGLWIWFTILAAASVVGWLILLPRPTNQSLGLVEKFLPYIVGVLGVWLIVRGFWPYGLGLLVFFFGMRTLSRTVNNNRLKRLDREARDVQAGK
jgi:hypothetical protein